MDVQYVDILTGEIFVVYLGSAFIGQFVHKIRKEGVSMFNRHFETF